MGNTIWFDIQGRDAANIPADNSIMLRLEKPLVKLSVKLKVPKLSSFYAYEAGWFQKWRWFNPSDALKAVQAIHDHLERNPNDLDFKVTESRKHWPEGLMKELIACRATLEGAAAAGKKFRFLIVA